jgi:cell division protein FtsB
LNSRAVFFLKSKGFLLFIIFVVFILILTFFFGNRGILEIIKARKQIQVLAANISVLESEKSLLLEQIDELKMNPLALEKTAREKLWLMKKNEKVIVIVRDKPGKKKTLQRNL